jgi:hypothetical protein
MIAITKTMIALSALMSAGVITAIDAVAPRSESPSASAQVAQRFPAANEMFAPASIADFGKLMPQPVVKADRVTASGSCEKQGWPYLSQDCLVSGDGAPARKVDRVITIHRGAGENTTELVRVPVADMAQR